MAKKDLRIYNIDHLSQFKNKDILISKFAPYLAAHHNLHTAHKHSFYHILLFTEGEGTHEIDFHTFNVKPFQIYFMIPGQVHSWSFEADVDGYVINFSPEFFQSFLLKPGYLEQFQFFTGNVEKSVIDLPKELESVIKLYFDELIRESETGEPYAQDMVKAILLQIFMTVGRLNFSRQQSSAHSSYSFTLFRNFQSLIERHYENLRLPKEYAELMSVTPNHLNALCRDYLGIPAGEVIRKRVILEAKRLLVNPDFSVSEIAYKLNFDDNSYFTKFFRKQAAVTPEEFRKKALNLVQKQNNQLK